MKKAAQLSSFFCKYAWFKLCVENKAFGSTIDLNAINRDINLRYASLISMF